eukprot:6890938-Lingulodinium_polyedra.AAC.1
MQRHDQPPPATGPDARQARAPAERPSLDLRPNRRRVRKPRPTRTRGRGKTDIVSARAVRLTLAKAARASTEPAAP